MGLDGVVAGTLILPDSYTLQLRATPCQTPVRDPKSGASANSATFARLDSTSRKFWKGLRCGCRCAPPIPGAATSFPDRATGTASADRADSAATRQPTSRASSPFVFNDGSASIRPGTQSYLGNMTDAQFQNYLKGQGAASVTARSKEAIAELNQMANQGKVAFIKPARGGGYAAYDKQVNLLRVLEGSLDPALLQRKALPRNGNLTAPVDLSHCRRPRLPDQLPGLRKVKFSRRCQLSALHRLSLQQADSRKQAVSAAISLTLLWSHSIRRAANGC